MSKNDYKDIAFFMTAFVIYLLTNSILLAFGALFIFAIILEPLS